MKKINWGLIGYGGMGGWHYEHALTSDVINPVAIYDIKEERCALAESRGIKAYRTLDEILSDKTIQLITVAIPNDYHEEVVIACLNAGKNVICEKPVTLSTESLQRMIDAANRNNVLFSVHQNRRWDVDYLAIQHLFDTNELGDVFDVQSRVHGSRGIPSDWRGTVEHGGGMLYDWGIHLIDQELRLYRDKKIVSVYCEFDNITNKEVDDGYRLTMFFENGARAYSEVGTFNFIPLPRFYVRAQKGTAVITDWRENCQVVKYKAWHENDVLPVKTAAGLTKTMAPRDEITVDTYELDRPVSDVHDYYRNYCAAINGKAELTVTHQQLMRVLKVVEAGFESAKSHQVIPFEDII